MEAYTREELLMAKAAGMDVTAPEPITREEMFLAKLAGLEVETPEPITRKEMLLAAAAENAGGGGGIKVAYGTFTPAEEIDVTYPNFYEIEHGLGIVPTFTAVVKNVNVQYATGYLNALLTFAPYITGGTTNIRSFFVYDGGAKGGQAFVNADAYKPNESTMFAGLLGDSTACKLTPCEHVWIAVGGV